MTWIGIATMYRLRILSAATRELERLDKPIARRIAERIKWNHGVLSCPLRHR